MLSNSSCLLKGLKVPYTMCKLYLRKLPRVQCWQDLGLGLIGGSLYRKEAKIFLWRMNFFLTNTSTTILGFLFCFISWKKDLMEDELLFVQNFNSKKTFQFLSCFIRCRAHFGGFQWDPDKKDSVLDKTSLLWNHLKFIEGTRL